MRSSLLKLTALLSLVILSTSSLNAQRIEDLPRIAMDTLDLGSTNAKVVIYTNNTWDFYFPSLDSLVARNVYTTNWVTDQVFAYKGTSANDLPASMELTLFKKVSEYKCPVVGRVTSKYGIRRGRNHNGIDIPLKLREPIYAAFPGVVRYARYNGGGYGNLVIVRHDNGLETWYGHLSKTNVEVGDYVVAGAVVGFAGSTGRSSGVHLHFEIRYQDLTFNPERIFDFATGDIRYQNFVLEKSFFNIRSNASELLEDNDEEIALLATEDGQEITSEDILANIEKIQEAEAKKLEPVYYTIKSGDTLSRIASRNGTTVSELCRLNGISRNAIIRAGRQLRIR